MLSLLHTFGAQTPYFSWAVYIETDTLSDIYFIEFVHSTPLHSTPPHPTPLHSTPFHSTPIQSNSIQFISDNLITR